MKDQKGITLVALIITIIVMLILVAVTISVALNGGLFTTAREAALETKVAEVKEAMALAKAEALASYYKNLGTNGSTLNGAQFTTLVNAYLDDSLDFSGNFTWSTEGSNPVKHVFTAGTSKDAEVNAYFAEHTADTKVIFEVPVGTN